ncbi:MAG: N-acetylglucosaminyl-diphospho-decaprenol L-rhamnosyltransferase [Solirubrobacteraceae bacterium]|nr:N-acetylglucosaminyl-diphospho-decaprenol L-rhamnosyltransferase [Solirubrobacteraceae bacterium]
MSPSIVIVAHRSRAELDALLPTLPAEAEVIVVDTDGSAAGLEGAQIVERHDNPGFGPANNAGVAIASREVCVLLNPDVVAPRGAIERLAALARDRDTLVVPRLRNADGSVQRSAFAVPGGPAAVLHALVPGPLRREPWRAERPSEVGWALAAALAAPTVLLRSLGPFDPDAFLFYEDMDLCLRARAAGIPTVLHPEVELIHLGGHSTAQAFGGEPADLLARRRRIVVEANLGRTARRWDVAAQLAEFASRSWRRRDRIRLRAVLRARG